MRIIHPPRERLRKKADWGEVKRVSIDEISQRKGHKDFATVVYDIKQGKLATSTKRDS